MMARAAESSLDCAEATARTTHSKAGKARVRFIIRGKIDYRSGSRNGHPNSCSIFIDVISPLHSSTPIKHVCYEAKPAMATIKRHRSEQTKVGVSSGPFP